VPLSDANRGRLLVVLAAVLWSTSGIFVKSPPLAALSPSEAGPMIAFWRTVVAAVVLLPLVRWSGVRWHPVLIPLVICFAAMNVLFISSMTLTTAANTILLQYTAPIWMFLGGVFLLREKADKRNAVGLALGMVGVAVILVAFWGHAEITGVLLGLGAGVAYAGVVLCMRVLRTVDSGFLVVACNLGSAAVLLPWVIATGAVPDLPQGGVIVAFGVVQVAAAYLVFARGMRRVTSQEAGIITLLEPILNPLWVLLLWHEPVAVATLVGGGFILGGLAVRYLWYDRGSTGLGHT
jgi:drug/metabolite transporter, DME family